MYLLTGNSKSCEFPFLFKVPLRQYPMYCLFFQTVGSLPLGVGSNIVSQGALKPIT